MYTIEELQEKVEELEKTINDHQDIICLLISALVDEDGLSEDAKDAINEAHKIMYGKKY